MKIPLYRNDQHGAVIGFSHQKPTTSVVGGFTAVFLSSAWKTPITGNVAASKKEARFPHLQDIRPDRS